MLLTKKALKGLVWGVRNAFSHYETLGVEAGATQQAIKSRYYELAKKYHPDLAQGESNSQKFVKIQEAYEVLGDEQKRKEYDRTQSSQSYAHKNEEYSRPYQRQWRNPHFQQDSPSDFSFHARPSIFTLLKENVFSIVIWCAYAYIFFEIVVFLERKMTEADIERENVLMMAQPGMAERRLKPYAQEIKEKNIYGRIVDLKIAGPRVKSTKAASEEKEGITSIEGLKKEGEERSRTILMAREEYM